MQLPRGTLVKTTHGPGTLASVTEDLAKENLTGYLRVSILSEQTTEYVIVYLAGKPVMAFLTVGNEDKPDMGIAGATAAIRQADSILEVCKLGENQVKLLQELYRSLAYVPSQPQPQPKPQPQQQQVPAKPPAPVQVSPVPAPAQERASPRQQGRFSMPEIRGRFVRSVRLKDIREYPKMYPGEAGHLIFIAEVAGVQRAYHAIILTGSIEATYDDKGLEPGLLSILEAIPGIAEFYAVDAAVLTSVLQRYVKNGQLATADSAVPPVPRPESVVKSAVPPVPRPESVVKSAVPPVPRPEPKPEAIVTPGVTAKPVTTSSPSPPAELLRPAMSLQYVSQAARPHPSEPFPEPAELTERPKTIGIPARAILEKSALPDPVRVGNDINRTVDEISQSMDDDVAMVRKVEQDFASHAEELLEKLDLGHLRKYRKI